METITLEELTPDYLIPVNGKYLVRTVSTHLKEVRFLQARCHIQWNEKRQRFETSIDVTNQTVTHISAQPLIVKHFPGI